MFRSTFDILYLDASHQDPLCIQAHHVFGRNKKMLMQANEFFL